MTKKRTALPELTDDVIVTRPFMGAEWGLMALCHMQVCAHSEVPPEQVEARANALNPTSTRGRWRIIRGDDESDPGNNANKAPVRCDQQPERIHYLLSC